MGKFVNLAGLKYGKLLVIKRVENDKQNCVCYLCQCDCGKLAIVRASSLKNGHTKSCGCLQKEVHLDNLKSRRKYDLKFTRLRRIFFAIKNRCYNPNSINYERYGAKGISIYPEWLKNPVSFCEWAYKNGYNENLTIDRINSKGNYEPSNCRWVNYETQANNKSNIPKYEYNNKKLSIAEWSRLYHISKSALTHRIKRGWDIEKALTTPVRVLRSHNLK